MSTHGHSEQLQFTGRILVSCATPTCDASVEVEVSEWEFLAELPSVAADLADEEHGWFLGRFCKGCSKAAKAEEKACRDYHEHADFELLERGAA